MRLAGLGLRARGDALRRGLARLMGRPLPAALTAALATALIHSSSVSTMAVVALVEAGALDLDTAAAAVIGANVGTTLPVQLLAWRPGPLIWLPVAAAGALLLVGGGRGRAWGAGICGFACLLGGLAMLDGAVAPLAARPWFAGAIALLATVALSSSVTLGVLQGLVHRGLLPLAAALPVVVGANIGTTTDTLLVSLGTGRAGRRTALFHLLFNVTGALAFMPLRGPLAGLLPGASLPSLHLVFNLLTALWAYPLRGGLLALTAIVPASTRDG
jgi:phosphate:Na+ symporter